MGVKWRIPSFPITASCVRLFGGGKIKLLSKLPNKYSFRISIFFSGIRGEKTRNRINEYKFLFFTVKVIFFLLSQQSSLRRRILQDSHARNSSFGRLQKFIRRFFFKWIFRQKGPLRQEMDSTCETTNQFQSRNGNLFPHSKLKIFFKRAPRKEKKNTKNKKLLETLR